VLFPGAKNKHSNSAVGFGCCIGRLGKKGGPSDASSCFQEGSVDGKNSCFFKLLVYKWSPSGMCEELI